MVSTSASESPFVHDSTQLAKSLKHSLALWQQSALGDFTYVVGWDATAWAMGMNFLPEERAAIEGSTQRYLKHYAQLRQRGKPLPPDLPITNKVEPCYIGKVGRGATGHRGGPLMECSPDCSLVRTQNSLGRGHWIAARDLRRVSDSIMWWSWQCSRMCGSGSTGRRVCRPRASSHVGPSSGQ